MEGRTCLGAASFKSLLPGPEMDGVPSINYLVDGLQAKKHHPKAQLSNSHHAVFVHGSILEIPCTVTCWPISLRWGERYLCAGGPLKTTWTGLLGLCGPGPCLFEPSFVSPAWAQVLLYDGRDKSQESG